MKKEHMPLVIGAAALVCVLIFILLCVPGTEVPSTEDTQTGWQTIDGQRYYLDSNGEPVYGWQVIDGCRYYFRQQGSLVVGWLNLAGKQYYLTENGVAIGPQTIDGKIYIFDDDGVLGSGEVNAAGQHYLVDALGHPKAGWHDSRYYDESGCMVTGWATIGNFRYYFHADGTPAVGQTSVDGKTYYFASNGQELPFVNPWHEIDPDYTVELTAINENHQIATIAYDDLSEMLSACQAAGLDPAICSSYRTREYQQMLFERKVSYYLKKGNTQTEAEALAGHSVAYPGTSEHQLGLALDIIDNSNWNLDESQAKTATQKWLMEHSWEYGWILRYPDGKSEITGIIYEPWHYRYVGREVAAEIYSLGICLEEYIELLSPGVG